MSATYVKSVFVNDPSSPFHQKKVDLLLSKAGVEVNPKTLPKRYSEISQKGLCVSPGWVDIGAAVGEPGNEQRETVVSLQAAARKGGYTDLFVLPEGEPAIDTRSGVEGLLARATSSGPVVHVIGAISKQKAGKELAELGDMTSTGVCLFSDGLDPIEDAKLLQVALDYAKPLNGTLLVQPGDSRLSLHGQVHEGVTSTRMGIPGIPALAEDIGLQRDLHIATQRSGRLHISAVSLANSIKVCEAAKKKHQGLTYGVAVLNLLLTDADTENYDVYTKVLPPLRPEKERKALVKAILDGKADALISNHQPHELEAKRVEFPYAAFGAATIEVAFGIASTAVGDAHVVATYFGTKNRTLAQLPAVTIQTSESADLTFYLPTTSYEAPASCAASLGSNAAVQGKTLVGQPFAIFCRNSWELC